MDRSSIHPTVLETEEVSTWCLSMCSSTPYFEPFAKCMQSDLIYM